MIVVEWPALLILAAAFVLVAWINAGCQHGHGGVDTIPGNGIGQAPDMEEVEARVGFRA